LQSISTVSFQRELNRARQLLLSQNAAEALKCYAQLTRQCPGEAIIWFEYGNAAANLLDCELADRAWRRALELDPRNAELTGLIGHQYLGLRKIERARECFARAAAADPRSINPRISLAVLLDRQHRLSEARAAVAECLAIDPRDDQGRYFSAVLDRRENRLEAAEQTLRDLIDSDPKHPYVRYACRYELAQILDRTDRVDEAIEQLRQAKELVRALTDTNRLLRSYDHGAEKARCFTFAQPRNILQTWAEYFPPRKREPIPALAFLGGHPRSGTTLLEEILDAHPGVSALDEPLAFTKVLEPAFHKTTQHSSARLNLLRRLYFRALLQEIGPGGNEKLLIDKNPSPTARLPLWLRVFPELRVVVALRDPRDVVLSCYFQNIPLNVVNVNFLSLENVAKHYADLMDIWLAVRQWEGFNWLETKYEAIVGGLRKEGGRVTEFLGLNWHEEQARFYDKSLTKQQYSPTYQDVTRPIYTRSVGRWRAYEKHLAPIFPKLERYCREFGYHDS
jgi:tetratricopeptide (TPR) repeat protein